MMKKNQIGFKVVNIQNIGFSLLTKHNFMILTTSQIINNNY